MTGDTAAEGGHAEGSDGPGPGGGRARETREATAPASPGRPRHITSTRKLRRYSISIVCSVLREVTCKTCSQTCSRLLKVTISLESEKVVQLTY